jgi:hypothetical protein
MLQAISNHVQAKTGGRYVLESITYRNIAPLYCDEQMVICGKIKDSSANGGVYDVWIEGPSGGVAVKGTVRTVAKHITRGPRISKVWAPSREPLSALAPENELGPADMTVRQQLRRVACPTSDQEPRNQRHRRVIGSEYTCTIVPPRVSLSSFTMASLPAHAGDMEPAKTTESNSATQSVQAPHTSTKEPRHTFRRSRTVSRVPGDTSRPPASPNLEKPVNETVSTIRKNTRMSIVRKYGGKNLYHDPAVVAQKQSRYLRGGVRKHSKLRVRFTEIF